MGWRNRIVGEGCEKPEDLLANPRNFRIHSTEQQRALSAVLNTVGIVDRVIVNRGTGFVVDGHMRVAMAISEGEDSIPVTYVDLSDDEEAVVLASFDRITGMAGTDSEKLAELLEEARGSEAAMESEDLAGLLDSPTPPAPEKSSGEGAGGAENETCPECGQPVRNGA